MIRLDHRCDHQDLDDVQPPRALLVFRDEGQLPAKQIGRFLLRLSGGVPRLHALGEEDFAIAEYVPILAYLRPESGSKGRPYLCFEETLISTSS